MHPHIFTLTVGMLFQGGTRTKVALELRMKHALSEWYKNYNGIESAYTYANFQAMVVLCHSVRTH